MIQRDLFLPSADGVIRLLLLVARFSARTGRLDGRTKLAKLDFLLRYPRFFDRAFQIRTGESSPIPSNPDDENIESRMIRFRYGPWDPAYYSLLGSLIGRRLIEVIPTGRGLSFKASHEGAALAVELASHPAWSETNRRAALLHTHFNLTGESLKRFIYANFPEVVSASWGELL